MSFRFQWIQKASKIQRFCIRGVRNWCKTMTLRIKSLKHEVKGSLREDTRQKTLIKASSLWWVRSARPRAASRPWGTYMSPAYRITRPELLLKRYEVNAAEGLIPYTEGFVKTLEKHQTNVSLRFQRIQKASKILRFCIRGFKNWCKTITLRMKSLKHEVK